MLSCPRFIPLSIINGLALQRVSSYGKPAATHKYLHSTGLVCASCTVVWVWELRRKSWVNFQYRAAWKQNFVCSAEHWYVTANSALLWQQRQSGWTKKHTPTPDNLRGFFSGGGGIWGHVSVYTLTLWGPAFLGHSVISYSHLCWLKGEFSFIIYKTLLEFPRKTVLHSLTNNGSECWPVFKR